MGFSSSSEDEQRGRNQVKKQQRLNFSSSASKSRSKSPVKQQQQKYNSRSRSRSHKKSHKSKSKKHSKRYESSSRSGSRDSRKKKSKKKKSHHKKDKKRKDSRNRDKKKKRSRSRSPLSYYSKNFKINTSNQYKDKEKEREVIEKEKEKERERESKRNDVDYFFDGFQYVPKMNSVNNTNVMFTTKKMRIVQVQGIPLEFGITSDSLKDFITQFMVRHALSDANNLHPILSVEIDPIQKTAIVEFSSVEETGRFCKIEKLKLYNKYCDLIRLGDTLYGGTNSLANLLNKQGAPVMAGGNNFGQMQQLNALQPMNSLQQPIQQEIQQPVQTVVPAAPVKENKGVNMTSLKVTNLFEQNAVSKFSEKEFSAQAQKLEDLFKQYGDIDTRILVEPRQSTQLIAIGTFFIQYYDSENAWKAKEKSQNQLFQGRKMKVEIMEDDDFERKYKCLSYI